MNKYLLIVSTIISQGFCGDRVRFVFHDSYSTVTGATFEFQVDNESDSTIYLDTAFWMQSFTLTPIPSLGEFMGGAGGFSIQSHKRKLPECVLEKIDPGQQARVKLSVRNDNGIKGQHHLRIKAKVFRVCNLESLPVSFTIDSVVHIR